MLEAVRPNNVKSADPSLVGVSELPSTPATTNSTNTQLLHVTTYTLQLPKLPSATTPRTPRLSDSLDSRTLIAPVVAKEFVRVGQRCLNPPLMLYAYLLYLLYYTYLLMGFCC